MDAIQSANAAIYPNTSAVAPQPEGKRQLMLEEKNQERNRAEAGAKEIQFSDAPSGDSMQRIETVSKREYQSVAESTGHGDANAEQESSTYGNYERIA